MTPDKNHQIGSAVRSTLSLGVLAVAAAGKQNDEL
jgi:hypothetical protein